MADPDPVPDDAAPVRDALGAPRVVAAASEIARRVGLAAAAAGPEAALQVS
jgi:hypothetical protein